MTPDRDAELRRRYPHVFSRPLMNDEPIRCRDGWFHLLDRLCRLLECYILELPQHERAEFYAQQVKEKFGGLRFYMSRSTEAMAQAIRGAEDASLSVCDVCGVLGTRRGGLKDGKPDGWYRVRCDEHDGVRGGW